MRGELRQIFRDAFERFQASSPQASGVNKLFCSQSLVQKRLIIFTIGTQGPDAGKWHLLAIQEASDNVEREILHERLNVTHFGGLCGSLQQEHLSS